MGDKSLGEIAIIKMGQSPKGESYNQIGQGVPLLNGPTEFGPSHPIPKTWTTAPTKLCTPGEILFCVRGSTTGRMNWSDQEYCLGRGLASFSAKSEQPEDTRFLYYLLNQELPSLLGLSAGSVFPNLSNKDFSGFRVYWPLQNIRYGIAETLGSLDDKIEHNRQMNHTLESLARAIFKSWFVDFDPVRAKIEGRQPIGMDAETAALFPDGFEESAIGEIPRGWKVAPLPDAIEVNPSRALKKGEIAPYLDMANMPTKGHRGIEWIDRPYGSGTRFKNGDTLLARITPCLENGKTAFVDFLLDEQVGWGSTEYIILRPKSPLPVEYGYYLARSDELRNHTILNMTGTSGRQRAPASSLDKYLIVLPPEPIALRFGGLVSDFITKIRVNDEESRTLAALRDALLPRLMSGEVMVKDMDFE